jgi:DNA-directed RNA polymerase subunit RPC12/RpoP/uncharacterized membrane protein
VRVDCNECGASLPIDAETRFVTCAKCSSPLVIKHDESAIYSALRADGDADGRPASERVSARPSAQVPARGEASLRLVVGAVLVASDVFWWLTEPSLQSLPVRIAILAAGVFLIVTGLWRAVAQSRARAQVD